MASEPGNNDVQKVLIIVNCNHLLHNITLHFKWG